MSEISEVINSIPFLHGTLEIAILDATTRPSKQKCMCMRSDRGGYVTVDVGGTRVAETTSENDHTWNQRFVVRCAHHADVSIKMELRTRLSVLGYVSFRGTELLRGGGEVVLDESSFPFRTKKGKECGDRRLRFRLRFSGVERECNDGSSYGVVEGATFPLRTNCDVVLYHDAHHRSGFRPLGSGGGRPGRLWEDIFGAIDGAQRLVFIVGWSLNPKTVLLRDPDTELQHGVGVSIGDLLKRKAEEGVAVRLLLWDDETSLPLVRNRGLMTTHDEDAVAFFKNTKVLCRLCPRSHHEFPTLFAHHQKTITVDSGITVVSFVGGFDLCDGRYDTEDHRLFRTLGTASNADDFYQVSIAGASLRHGGPRTPWHDVHARVTGSAALDILANFQQRWAAHCDASLLPAAPEPHSPSSLSWHWNVQVLRSIDASSVKSPTAGFVERSVHDAYVVAIRRAERFIYIENQYFMGSCHLWEKDLHCGCVNLIPAEIALKVAAKIRAGQRFAVYVVMPMWPEGLPGSEAVQEMLHWTRLTMSMMYRLIAEALSDVRQRSHPRDYLNFFCLANREADRGGEMIPASPPERQSDYGRAQRNRRFMIYVHSKLMIVDDEYVVVGSANVNQRSMDGRRDTEIGVGCWESSGGVVRGFRLGLWGEHMGAAEKVFWRPEGLECVSRVREIGDWTWKAYTGKNVVDTGRVHLVSYPVGVGEDGSVGELDDYRKFPDTSAMVRGKKSHVLPTLLTT